MAKYSFSNTIIILSKYLNITYYKISIQSEMIPFHLIS